MLAKYVAVRLAKDTWQAMHGDSHSCKNYKPLLKQELINRLSGKHPRTPLTQISSVAAHRSDDNGARLLFTTVLFFFALLSFLKIAQFFVICLVHGKLFSSLQTFLSSAYAVSRSANSTCRLLAVGSCHGATLFSLSLMAEQEKESDNKIPVLLINFRPFTRFSASMRKK